MSAAIIKTTRKTATSKKKATLPPPDLAADFARGRDLAIEMMREAVAIGDEREGWRVFRGGKAQDNLAEGYLRDVIEDPTLRPGFTAILSAAMQNEVDLSALASITLAETQAGPIGEDGTTVRPAVDPEGALAPSETRSTAAEGEIANILESAGEILDGLLEGLNDSAAYGANTLLGIAQKRLGQSVHDQTQVAIDDANVAIDEARMVLACVNGKFEDIRVQGVITLLGLAKEKHDVIVSAFYAAKRIAAA